MRSLAGVASMLHPMAPTRVMQVGGWPVAVRNRQDIGEERANDLFERRLLERVCGVRAHVHIALNRTWEYCLLVTEDRIDAGRAEAYERTARSITAERPHL
jgi:hypothetical protein